MTKKDWLNKAISEIKPNKNPETKKEKSVYRDSLEFMQRESDLDFYSLNPDWNFKNNEKY